jgi:hypothetical protein
MLVTEDRSTIITADEGNESLLVLWNSRTGNPITSIPQAHTHGITAMDLSPNGEWLATVSAPAPETGEQEVRPECLRMDLCTGLARTIYIWCIQYTRHFWQGMTKYMVIYSAYIRFGQPYLCPHEQCAVLCLIVDRAPAPETGGQEVRLVCSCAHVHGPVWTQAVCCAVS